MTIAGRDVGSSAGYRPLRIVDLPADLKPREILKRVGSRCSSADTLLSVVLRVGVPGANVVETSRRLLTAFGSLSALGRATSGEIVAKRIPGIGETKALQIVAALELGKRCACADGRSASCEARYARTSEDVLDVLIPYIMGRRQESFYVILLGPRNKIIAEPVEVAHGQRDEVALQPNLVYERALKEGACAIIVAHNHPSGDVEPSEEDLNMTRKLIDAGKLLNIALLDHVIVWAEDGRRFFSIAASGMVDFT